jgi:dTDP-4-dehydrorhamnose 3,5-epimerase
MYKVAGGFYDPKAERGVIWNDPDLALPWPVDPAEVLVSDKDARLPRLAACDTWF